MINDPIQNIEYEKQMGRVWGSGGDSRGGFLGILCIIIVLLFKIYRNRCLPLHYYLNMADKEFLRYRIHSVSSQEEPNSVFKLLDTHQEQGWVSAANPSYPQYIIIQFFLPVRTTTMNILFHQYKIPSLVEIFIKDKRGDAYQRLGHVKPSNNEQTGFEQRELKSVYFEYPCSFIKFVLHEPYPNKYNVLKQVALEEIGVKGAITDPDFAWLSLNTITVADDSSDEEVNDDKQSERYRTEQKGERRVESSKPITESSVPEIESLLKILTKKKDEAVEDQNYELASLIKGEIQNIKGMESRLFEFENNKRRALENEDYDQAAVMRNQILKLKQSIQYQLGRLTGSSTNQSFSLNSPEPKQYQKEMVSVSGSRTFISEHDSQVVTALANRLYQGDSERRIDADGDSKLIKNIQKQTKIIEQLDTKTQMQIQKYEHIISLSYWVAILGKNWKLKEQVLLEVNNLNFETVEEIYACLELCSFGIRDKHPTVLVETMKVLLRSFGSQTWNEIHSMPPALSSILIFLPPLLVESNNKVRDLVLQCLLDLPDLPCVNMNQIISLILPKKSKALKEIPKLTQAKLILAQLLITRYKFSNDQASDILEWSIGLLEDSNQDIRAAASDLIISSLVPILGMGVVVNKAKNVRPNVLNHFITALNTSQRQTEGSIENLEYSKNRTESREDIELSESYRTIEDENPSSVKFHNNLVTDRSKLEESEREIKVFEYASEDEKPVSQSSQENERRDLCDYCKTQLQGPDYDKSFQNHLFQCKMMATCEQCSCLIYIRGFCDHLLHDCQKSKYHQCSHCGLAFPFQSLHSHKVQGTCRPRKKGFQRCQICCKDVLSDDDAWIAHANYCK